MADYFFDSSALAKRYRAEVGSTKVEELLAEPGARYLISRLTVLELQSVFARKVRTGLITEADLEPTRTRLLNDITQGPLQVIRMTDFHYREAPAGGGPEERGGGTGGQLPTRLSDGPHEITLLYWL